jgi:hypothetical protein
MNARVPVPTPESLSDRLSAASGSKDRFGSSAAEVLDLAQQVAAAHSDWDKSTIAAFQKEQDIHPKVWGKLVSIAKSKNLRSLPEEDLPASYTALYALEVMKQEELTAALKEGLLKRNPGEGPVSTRSILDWTKAYRLRGTGIEQEIPLTLVLRDDLAPQEQQDLLEALKAVATQYGADLLEGKGGVKQAAIKSDLRKVLAQQIEEDLMREIGEVVANAPDDLKDKFKIQSALDLISGPRETFTGFFQVLEGKAKEGFWQKYGRAYCLKIARDFNLTESRAERYQLRKRLDMAIERWGIERCIEGFKETAEDIKATYMAG